MLFRSQLAAILRDTISLNETDLQAKDKAHLRAQLIGRLHTRYLFPGYYSSTHPKTNIVNSQALLKFTKHLSGYKRMVRAMVKDGKDLSQIQAHFPKVTAQELKHLIDSDELLATKKRREWGQEMRDLNIGNHHLGCRGYVGKNPIWDKEDEAYRQAGIENPHNKFPTQQANDFLRSRYAKQTEDGKLVTNPKLVKDVKLVTSERVMTFEAKLVRNLPT